MEPPYALSGLTADTAACLRDSLRAAGLAAAVTLFYTLMSSAIPRRARLTALFSHILFFAAAGFICFLFVLGRSESREPRWFMAAGAVAGSAVYYGAVRPWLRALRKLVSRLLAALLGLLGVIFSRTLWPLASLAVRPLICLLQMLSARVYNLRNRLKQRGRRGHEAGGEQPKRKPVKAYTQT